MGALVSVTNPAVPRRTYANTAPSNTVTNTTSETAFDQYFTMPSQFEGLTPNSLVRFYASGIMSTGLLNLGFTFRIRWGGAGGTIVATTGGISLTASLSDGGWYCRSEFMIRTPAAAGAAECQTLAAFQAGALTAVPIFMPSTGTFAIDTTTQNDIVLTVQWNTATANNSIQVRSMVAEIDTPVS